LRDDRDLTDAIAAVFFGGTITGAPKPRTMEIIDELEATRRGPYTGSIGIFGFDGRATLNILIRTLVRYRRPLNYLTASVRASFTTPSPSGSTRRPWTRAGR